MHNRFIVNVKMWVQLNIPKIEDGNQFGLQVQESMIEEVQTAEDLCCTVAEEVSRYYTSRGKICDKRKKYPGCLDYARVLWEMDTRRIILNRARLRQMRDMYCLIIDSFTKNSRHIQKPTGNQYGSMMM